MVLNQAFRTGHTSRRRTAPRADGARAEQTSSWLTRHRDLLVGSLSLMGTTAVTSAGGFVFWIVVAQRYPATEVGHATAMVSVITFLSSIGVFGLGTMLIGELSGNPARVDPLLSAALEVAAVLAGGLAAVVAIVVAVLPDTGLHQAFGNGWWTYVLFVIAVAVSSSALVFDQASLGLGLGHVQWLRNTVMCVTRIGVVVAAAGVLAETADSVLAVWTGTAVVSLLAMALPMRRHGIHLLRMRSPGALRDLVAHTAQHNSLNLSLSIPRLVVPIIVAMYAAGTTTAVFYVCWMIAGFLYFVPTNLSTALFAVAAGDTASLRRKARVSLAISAGAGAVGVPTVIVLAGPLLSMFGDEYAGLGAVPLMLLALQYVPNAIKQHYAAMLRVRGRVRHAGVVCGGFAVAEIAAVAVALQFGGIVLASAVLGVVLCVEGAVMLPVVVAGVWPDRTPAAAPAGAEGPA